MTLRVKDTTTSGSVTTTIFVDLDAQDQTLTGNGRLKKTLQLFPYDFVSQAGTYNSIVCAAAGASVLAGRFHFKSFDDGVGGGQPEACNMNFTIPEDFDESTTDIIVRFTWVAAEISGTEQVRWQCGIIRKAIGADMSAAAGEVYATPQNITPPTTLWARAEATFTITNGDFARGDDICIIIFRDADNAADNADGDAYVGIVSIEYVANRMGGSM